MNRVTPKFRHFAERLISIGATQAKSSASKPPKVFAAIEELRPSLAQVVGVLGLSAVLSRALATAHTDVAWLRTVHVSPDGSLGGLDEVEANVDPKDIAAGRVVLLAEFISLLTELIGERLVLKLVQQAISKVSKIDLYF